jgi:hypothetical protein
LNRAVFVARVVVLSLLAPRDAKDLSRAGEADVAEAAFFIQAALGAVGERLLVRQDFVLQADEVDDVEFQPLARVKRHQPHALSLFMSSACV